MPASPGEAEMMLMLEEMDNRKYSVTAKQYRLFYDNALKKRRFQKI